MKKMKLISFLACLALNSCTISVTQVHNEGGSDVVDENQKADAQVSPDISLPAFGDLSGRDVGFNFIC